MFDLPYVKPANECACEGTVLEQDVKGADSVFIGRIARIGKRIDGLYTVSIRLEESWKGETVSGSRVRYTLSGDCLYPFERNRSYAFVMNQPAGDGSMLDSCRSVVDAADIEMLRRISVWLDRRIDGSEPVRTDGEEAQQDASVLNGARHIYDVLASRLGSVRIEEDNYRTWTYQMDDELFFYSPGVKISFFVPIFQPVTQADYERFASGISVIRAANGAAVPFSLGEVSLEVKELPIVLKLTDAPEQDIVIRFQAPGTNERFEVKVRHAAPFTYTIRSPSDPTMEQYIALLQDGYQAAYHVASGRTHSFVIAFNQPVDRSSVYERLNENFRLHPTVAWSLQWLNDYEVRLTLIPDDETNSAITFNLNGVMTEAGYRLLAKEQIVIQPGEPVLFQSIDPVSGGREVYFTSLTPYDDIDVSPGGNYVLAAFRAHNGMHAVYQYVVRDRFGTIRKLFPIEAIHHPVWVDDARLVYASEDRLIMYSPAADEETVVWTAPGDRDNEKIVSLDYSAEAGKLAVGYGYTTDRGDYIYDLHVLNGATFAELAKIEAFGSFECWEGRCAAPSVLFTTENRIMYSRWETLSDGTFGFTSVLYETDLDSFVTRRVDPFDETKRNDRLLFPLKDGSVLVIANDERFAGAPEEEWIGIREQWSVYEPDTAKFQILIETNLGLFTNYWIDRIIPLGEHRLLMYIYGLGWYVMDMAEKSFLPFSVIDPAIAVDVEKDRIWILE